MTRPNTPRSIQVRFQLQVTRGAALLDHLSPSDSNLAHDKVQRILPKLLPIALVHRRVIAIRAERIPRVAVRLDPVLELRAAEARRSGRKLITTTQVSTPLHPQQSNKRR